MFYRMPIAAVIAFAATMAACEAQCSVSTASLSEESMANAVAPDTKAPVARVTSFAPDAPAIYATAKLSNAPPGTRVRATFHYLEGGDRDRLGRSDGRGHALCDVHADPSHQRWPAVSTKTFLPQPARRASVSVQHRGSDRRPRHRRVAPPLKQFHDERSASRSNCADTWAYRVTPEKATTCSRGRRTVRTTVDHSAVRREVRHPGSSAAAQTAGSRRDARAGAERRDQTRDSMEAGWTAGAVLHRH